MPDPNEAASRPPDRTTGSPRTAGGCERCSPTRGAAAGSPRASGRRGTPTTTHWVIPDEAVDQPGFRWADWFGREAPMIVEIGSGIGEATAALAPARPSYDVLAFEVWRPGVAEACGASPRAARPTCGSARWTRCGRWSTWSAPGAVAELWTFFPDPWHKKKHHKRRLVTPSFAALAASRLAPGAVWRLATDWADYAEQMVEVLDAEPLLSGGVVPRWEERPVTKFERKGLAAGRTITDLTYERI